MTDFPRLALVDWGIGGMSVRAALATLAPGAPVAYWSDTGAVPYGKLARHELETRLARVVEALAERGAAEVFFACNAASTVLDGRTRFALPVSGMIAPAIACAHESGARRLGVVGGTRTIRSGVYGRGLATSERVVLQRIAQPLSATIEAGDADSPETAALVRNIVAPLRSADALLLACTHYGAARAAFERALPGVAILDPAMHAARTLVGRLGRFDDVGGDSRDRLFTTGDPAAMRTSAARAFGVALGAIERASVDQGAGRRSRT